MSFLTAVPEELLAAAGKLGAIGNSLAAQNAGAAEPTSAILPAASDQISAVQAAIFGEYGTLYQQIAAEAQAIHDQFVSVLGLSSGTYSDTESANAAAATANAAASSTASTPVSSLIDSISTFLGGPLNSAGGNPFGLSSNGANFISYESGNWASAMSCLVGLAGGGLIPSDDLANLAGTAGGAGADAGVAAAADAGMMSNVTPVMGGTMGGGMGGLGQASLVGKLSVPPSWASVAPTGAIGSPIQTVGWTGAAPQAGTGAIIPGMPGMGAARNSAGFGAPRYGIKPIVMPKPTAV
jgi:hypothetical protein